MSLRKPEPAVTLTLPVHVAESICHCLRCGHWWMKRPNADVPVFCPKCKRRHWDVPAGSLRPGPARSV
jgi:hypothetical protein